MKYLTFVSKQFCDNYFFRMNNIETNNHNRDVYGHPDSYMMQDGIIMISKNGTLTPMEDDVTLSNGAVILKSGVYMKRGGTKNMFKEGEHVDLTGKMISIDN